MENLGIVAFMMAMSALGIAIIGFLYAHGRINNLEKKLKEFDVIPTEFDSISKEFRSLKETLDKGPLSND